MNLKEFAEKEHQKLEAETQKYREENNLPGFWVPSKGENRFTVLEVEPREKDFGDGPRKIFHIKVKEEERDWAINPRNPAYRELVRRIKDNQTVFVLLRTGEGRSTRYEFLER